MLARWIWGAALFIYLIFLAWHENWRGQLTAAEISFYTERMNTQQNLTVAQRSVIVDFMKSDNGEEFFMVNLMAFPDGTLRHPKTGESTTPQKLLTDYSRPFLGKLLLSGGYPAMTGPVVGGYLDAWNVAANPGWDAMGVIRYRSRRDMMEAATDASFSDGHALKQLALQATLAVPAISGPGLLMTPRSWFALLLLAMAALAHLMLLTFRKGKPTNE